MPLPNISHENLVHFNCPLCLKWWSISGAPEFKEAWYCTWCGVRLEDKEDTRPLSEIVNSTMQQLEFLLKHRKDIQKTDPWSIIYGLENDEISPDYAHFLMLKKYEERTKKP